MATTYPEFMRSSCKAKGVGVCTIDLGGALNYQGPITPAQQGKLMAVFSEIATENVGLAKEVQEAMKAAAAESESAKKSAPAKSNTPAKK